jgi:hypothetical protein
MLDYMYIQRILRDLNHRNESIHYQSAVVVRLAYKFGTP